MQRITYVGHSITVEDGGDVGAITYVGFATDEEAVSWAASTFPQGTWRYAPLAARQSLPVRHLVNAGADPEGDGWRADCSCGWETTADSLTVAADLALAHWVSA